MSYCYKKIVILSEYSGASPVFTAERDGAHWRYELLSSADTDGPAPVVSDGKTFARLLGTSGFLPVSPENGISVALISGGNIVSFGANGVAATKSDFLRWLSSEGEPVYDDEAIAETDYYKTYYEQENEDVIPSGSRQNHENAQKSGERAYDDGTGARAFQTENGARADARPLCDPDGAFTAENGYYGKIRRKIERLFRTNEPFSSLSEVIPQSRWVKLDKNGKPFYLGVCGAPDYICYAARGARGDIPPENAFFVPESIISPTDMGYFMIFQSATTGKIIKRRPAGKQNAEKPFT